MQTVLNIIMFEDCRNQWSMSRPLLGLILLNEDYFQQLRDQVLFQIITYSFDALYIRAYFKKWHCSKMIDFPGDTITAVSQTVKYGNVVQKSNGRHREKFVDKE